MAVEHLLQLRSQHAERLPRLVRVPPQRLAILLALAGAEAGIAVTRHGGCSCFKRLVKLSQGSTSPCQHSLAAHAPIQPIQQRRHAPSLCCTSAEASSMRSSQRGRRRRRRRRRRGSRHACLMSCRYLAVTGLMLEVCVSTGLPRKAAEKHSAASTASSCLRPQHCISCSAAGVN